MKNLFFLFCCTILVSQIHGAPEAPYAEKATTFRFSFAYYDENETLHPLEPGSRVEIDTGVGFTLYFQPLTSSYFYIFQTLEETTFRLFPNYFDNSFSNEWMELCNFFIPHEDDQASYYPLKKGKNKFHIIVTPERLPELEQTSSPEPVIQKLKNRTNPFLINPGNPKLFAGTILPRSGVRDMLLSFAKEYTGEKLYISTIIIENKE